MASVTLQEYGEHAPAFPEDYTCKGVCLDAKNPSSSTLVCLTPSSQSLRETQSRTLSSVQPLACLQTELGGVQHIPHYAKFLSLDPPGLSGKRPGDLAWLLVAEKGSEQVKKQFCHSTSFLSTAAAAAEAAAVLACAGCVGTTYTLQTGETSIISQPTQQELCFGLPPSFYKSLISLPTWSQWENTHRSSMTQPA